MTENSTKDATGLDALEQVLERFGSDRTRWPAPVRRDFAGLIARDPAAKARLREAEALDRLLDLAPQPEFDTHALAGRIVAAAALETPVVSRPKGRVGWAAFDRRPAGEQRWAAAALLAASLVLGAVFGLNGTFDSAVAPLVADASTTDDEIDPGQVAFDSDGITMFEGDLL